MVFKKGQIAWNKGKTFSEESKIKMRISSDMYWNHSDASEKHREILRNAHLGIHQSVETIKKRVDKNRGKKRSPEQCKRISESVMGRVSWNKGKEGCFSEETKQKMRKNNARAMLGKHQSDEMKNKIRLTHLGRHRSEETKKRLSESHLGGKNPMWGKPAYNKGLNLSGMLGKHHTENTKKKISLSKKKLWQNKDFAKRNILALQIKPNGKELYLDFLLQNHFPDEWKYVGDGQVIIGGLCPDFINCNGKKQIIELFGDYWHNRKNIRYNYTEIGRKEAFLEYGFSTLIVWEHELKDKTKVIEKIRSFSE